MTTHTDARYTLEDHLNHFEYLMTAYDHNNRKLKFVEMREATQKIADSREYLNFYEDGYKFHVSVLKNRNAIGLIVVKLNGKTGEITVEVNAGDTKSFLFVKTTSGELLELRLDGEQDPFNLENPLLGSDIMRYLVRKLMIFINNELAKD